MSYENSGIPLVVRYNTRGEPDGLKEELNIRVTSIEADTYLGGDLGISALSAVQDLQLSSPIQTGDTLIWSGQIGKWVNRQPQGGTGTPGAINFVDLDDTPGTYVVGSPGTPNDAILRVDTTATTTKITFSPYGETDLDNYESIYTQVTAAPTNSILIRGTNPTLITDFELDRGPEDILVAGTYPEAAGQIVKFGVNGAALTYSTVSDTELKQYETRIGNIEGGNLANNATDVYYTPAPETGNILVWDAGGYWKPATPPTGLNPTFIGLSDTPDGWGSGNTNRIVTVYYDATTSEYELAFAPITSANIDTAFNNITGLQSATGTINDRITNEVTALNATINSLSLTSLDDVNFTLVGDATDTGKVLTYTHGVTPPWGAQLPGAVSIKFEDLTDVPSYAGAAADANKILIIDSDGSGVAYANYTSAVLEQIGTNQTNITTNTNRISTLETGYNYFSATINGFADDRALVTDSSTPLGFSSRPFQFAQLTDTTITNIQNDDTLLWKSNTWKNAKYLGFNISDPGGGEAPQIQAQASGLGVLGLQGETFLKIVSGTDPGTPSALAVSSFDKVSTTEISTTLPQGETLIVGPSGTITSISTAPLEGQEGKLRLINQSSTAEVDSSALIWDYTSEGLQVIGDVSAQNYYGNFSGSTAELYNISGVSSIQFATDMPAEYTAVEGEVYYDTDAHTLSIQTGSETTLQVGQEQVIRIRNETGNTINNGAVVFVSGVQGTGVAKLLGGLASASVSEKDQDIIGVATQTMVSGSDGFITTFGIVRGIDTSGYAVGDLLYLDTVAGGFTTTKPASPNHPIRLGIVLREHQTEGAIFVDIQPGYDAADLHDVSTSGIQTGDVLVWDGTIFSPSAFDHGLLAGKTDDDHTQYVFKSPAGTSRNTVQPASDVPALTLQAGLSQTEPLFVVKDALTATTLTIDSDGNYSALGDIDIDGTLRATSKSFLIDHPTKEGMKLQYTCLEGPENGVYCRGRSKTNVIILPDYWVGLVDEDSISVNLTPAGKPQPDLFVSNIVDNKIFLERSSNEPIDCFYTIYATRKDIKPLIVEF